MQIKAAVNIYYVVDGHPEDPDDSVVCLESASISLEGARRWAEAHDCNGGGYYVIRANIIRKDDFST